MNRDEKTGGNVEVSIDSGASCNCITPINYSDGVFFFIDGKGRTCVWEPKNLQWTTQGGVAARFKRWIRRLLHGGDRR